MTPKTKSPNVKIKKKQKNKKKTENKTNQLQPWMSPQSNVV